MHATSTNEQVFCGLSNFQILKIKTPSYLPRLLSTCIWTCTLLILVDRRTPSFVIITITRTLKRVWVLRRNDNHAWSLTWVSSTCKWNCTSTIIWSSQWNIMVGLCFLGRQLEHYKCVIDSLKWNFFLSRGRCDSAVNLQNFGFSKKFKCTLRSNIW